MNNLTQGEAVNEQYLRAALTWLRLRLRQLAEQLSSPSTPSGQGDDSPLAQAAT